MGVKKEEMPTIRALVYEDGIYPRKYIFEEDAELELPPQETIHRFIE
jgi:hypothetical protein